MSKPSNINDLEFVKFVDSPDRANAASVETVTYAFKNSSGHHVQPTLNSDGSIKIDGNVNAFNSSSGNPTRPVLNANGELRVTGPVTAYKDHIGNQTQPVLTNDGYIKVTLPPATRGHTGQYVGTVGVTQVLIPSAPFKVINSLLLKCPFQTPSSRRLEFSLNGGLSWVTLATGEWISVDVLRDIAGADIYQFLLRSNLANTSYEVLVTFLP